MKEARMFSVLFRGLSRAYVRVELLDVYEDRGDKGRKREAKTFWVREEMTSETYEKHLTGQQGLALQPVTDAGTCFFGVIDIDEYVWSAGRLKNLSNKILQLKLPMIAARSKSGGVRLYVFCEESPAGLMMRYLKACAAVLGFPKAEIFPNTERLITERGEVGHSISLPYFSGNETTCAGFTLAGNLTVQDFLKLALSKLQKTADLKTVPGLSLENAEEFSDGPPCLQSLSVNGFPEGSRNNALFNVGVYLKLKYQDDGPERYLDDYNLRMMKPPLDSRSVQILFKSLRKKTYYYKCKQEPICGACNKDLCLTRKFGVGSGNAESNITIGKMTKLDLQPPIWLVEINNRKLQLETEDFTNLSRFMTVCIEHLHLIPNVSLGKLRVMIQSALDTVHVEEAPHDASPDGQCIALFHRYLSSRPPAGVKEDVLFGAPWYENGYVYFRGKDFMDFLDMEKFRQCDSRHVYAVLRDYNIKHGGETSETSSFRINDRVVRLRRVKYDKPVFITENNEEY